jgi:hypothetical protein
MLPENVRAPGPRTAHHRPVRVFLFAVLSLALLAPAASAHPRAEGYSRGFQSTVLSVRPDAGLEATVVDGDDRLRVVNEGRRELVIFGYDGEPYLRIGPGGVYRNQRSPAAYLNRDRFARVAVPLSADPRARPQWRRVSDRPAWQWHDHRIQWMASGPPVEVRDSPETRHTIFQWRVPGRLGAEAVTIDGRLDYEPVSGNSASTLLLAAVVATGAAALLGLGFLAVRLRRGDEAPAEAAR